MEFSGVVYDTHNAPSNPHYILSIAQLKALMLDLPGKPIRIEHREGQDVGHIVRASVHDGRAIVTWVMDNKEAETLITSGEMPELSLKHWSLVIPEEVSLVARGARPGSIVCDQLECGYPLAGDAGGAAPHTQISASADQEYLSKAPAQHISIMDSTAAAASAEPPAKRSKLDYISELEKLGVDGKLLQPFADMLSDDISVMASMEAELAAVREQNRAQEEKIATLMNAEKTSTLTHVNTLLDVVNAHVPASIFDEAARLRMADAVAASAELSTLFQQAPLFAGAVTSKLAAVEASAAVAVSKLQTSRLASAEAALATARGLSGAPSIVHPQFTSAPVAAPYPAPAVAIAASADSHLPAALLKRRPYGSVSNVVDARLVSAGGMRA
jgi:hypothetical protein